MKTFWIALLLLSVGHAQEEEAPTTCTKLLNCHKEHDKEKVDCPQCQKTRIPKNDASCTSCATKAKTCAHCGLARGSGGSSGSTLKDAHRVISAKEMQTVLTKLASDEFEGRQTSSEGIRKARSYLIEHIKKAGLKPAGKDYELPWESCANIGCVVPGTDPKLKDEYIVMGSHYDHIGRSPGGTGGDDINNGADDNGSGSTVNLFIAKALAASKIKLKRSILHLWFSGEEQGLNGSRAYCNSPAIPMKQCVAMLNCDMLGRNPNKAADLFGTGSSRQFGPAIVRATQLVPEANVKVTEGKGQYFMRSDQANFWDKGVPVMFIFSGMHADYHKPSDESDKIAYDRMAALARYMLTILVELANHEGKIEVNPDFK